MNGRIFSEWFSSFRSSINGYDYYTDFIKVYRNAERLKIEINILNSLIGSKDIENDFKHIIHKYPECIKALPILLAVRENEIFCKDNNGALIYKFNHIENSADQYIYFMRKTGLFDMLENHIINNLYDYVTGVEVGLDSNSRKNRGGDCMENLVEEYIKKSGVEYYKEMYLSDIERKWNVDLSSISAEGTSSKRWDFVVKVPSRIFVLETNFYSSSGSKLNETARSYKMIATEAKNINNFSFVWITDGGGWKKAVHNLEETFNVLKDIYNIRDMENGILNKLFI